MTGADSFRRLLGGQERPTSRNVESLEIDHKAKERLKHAENQYRDVVAAPPESPAEPRDYCARHESKKNKTRDVISIGYVASTDCPRGKEMTEQASDEEQHTDPNPAAALYVDHAHRV